MLSRGSLRFFSMQVIYHPSLHCWPCLGVAPKERRLAGLTGLEPATFRVTGERSNQTELQPQQKLNESRKGWLLGQDSNLRPND